MMNRKPDFYSIQYRIPKGEITEICFQTEKEAREYITENYSIWEEENCVAVIPQWFGHRWVEL